MTRRRMRLAPTERERLIDLARDGPLTKTRACDTLGLTLAELNRILDRDKKATAAWDEAQQRARDLVAHRYFALSVRAESESEKRHALTEYRDAALGVPEAQQGQRPSVEVVVQLPAALTSQQYARVIEHEPATDAAE